jgi:hypothetical protein
MISNTNSLQHKCYYYSTKDRDTLDFRYIITPSASCAIRKSENIYGRLYDYQVTYVIQSEDDQEESMFDDQTGEMITFYSNPVQAYFSGNFVLLFSKDEIVLDMTSTCYFPLVKEFLIEEFNSRFLKDQKELNLKLMNICKNIVLKEESISIDSNTKIVEIKDRSFSAKRFTEIM